MFQRNVLRIHTFRINVIAETSFLAADDVEGRFSRHHETEFKFFSRAVVGEPTHIAEDGEPRAHNAVQRSNRRYSENSGFS